MARNQHLLTRLPETNGSVCDNKIMNEPVPPDPSGAAIDMRALLHSHDWAATPLGERASWPPELRVAVDLMLDARYPALVGWSGDALILYNDAYAALLGTRHPAVLGQPMRDIWPALYPEVAAEVASAMGGVPAHVEDHCVALPWEPGGGQRWFSSSYSPLRDAGGQVLGFFHAAFETTARVLLAQRAEKARRDSEARLSAVFDSLPVGIGVTDADGAIVLANQAMERYMPTRVLPSRDALRHASWTVFGTDGIPVGPDHYPGARALRGERVVPGVEGLYREDGGSETWTHIASVPIRDDAGAIMGQVSVVTDIDKVKRTEAALRLSEDKYRSLFEQMDAGFCIIEVLFDADGVAHDFRYLEINPMFETQTGLHAARGRTLSELVPGAEPFWVERAAEVALGGASTRFEGWSARQGRWFEINASRVGEPGAHQVALLFRDTTERKRIEEDMRRLASDASEASRRKSEFLAVLAHELRNPMAPIRTGLEIMRLRADSPETIERVREMLDRQTRQMTHLIDDLLDVARVTSGKIEIRKQLVDLNRVVASAVETSSPMIQSARHTLDVVTWDEPLLLEIDPTRIAQVVGNLLTNAAKYTPAGGRIALAVRKESGEAVVAVTDSGVGLAPESQEEIFEMFNQVGRNMGLAQGGLGIGLALVRQLVALHGGSVTASSDGVGTGSTFVLRLPLGARPAAGIDDAVQPERRSVQRRTFRILVVDDNTDAAESLSLLLQLNAHEIRTATNGKDALALAAQFRPDIAFLDIGMPGMTGYELAVRLRQLPDLARLHIVAVTGWGSEEDQARSREAGIDQHFTKPIAAETVSRLLSQID